MGKTAGKLPYMEYGPGDDRLGGAKMTYLDSQILVRVTDSLQNDYIVQLSARHFGFIPKEQVRWTDSIIPKPWYLSGSMKVYGDDRYDYVSIQLPEKLPYRSQMHINPARITVDIFGLTSNTNWITQLKSAKGISHTRYEQPEDDVFRINLDLTHNQHWGYQVYYDTAAVARLTIRVKRQPPSLDIRKLRIAIDAGHGGTNTGASGVTSRILEKDYTLLLAKELEKSLRRTGVTDIVMTRYTDTTLDMPQRILMLRDTQPDLLISVHLNSASADSIHGTSTFYRYAGFRPLSVSVLNRMLQLDLAEFGNVGSFNFALSGPTEYPNCLVEVAFLSNASDEKKILDAGFRKRVAVKIQEGIKDWLKQARNR